MTNENNCETRLVREEKTCLCQSKGFKKFVIIAGGSFVGVFCALSLFAALHKPPMMYGPFGPAPMMRTCPYHAHHVMKNRHYKGDFHRKMGKGDFYRIERKNFDKKPVEKSQP